MGGNYAKFQDGDGEGKTGLFIGIEKDWNIHKRLSFISGVNYVTKGVTLKNKIVKYNSWDASVFVYDINCSIGFLDVPICIKYKIPIYKKFGLQIYWGPSLSVAAKDLSSTRLIDEYLSQETKNDLTIAELYWWRWDNSGWALNYGFGFEWSHFVLECRYTKDKHQLKHTQGINIRKEYETIAIICGYSL